MELRAPCPLAAPEPAAIFPDLSADDGGSGGARPNLPGGQREGWGQCFFFSWGLKIIKKAVFLCNILSEAQSLRVTCFSKGYSLQTTDKN